MARTKQTSDSGFWVVELAAVHDSTVAAHRYLPGEHTVNEDLKAEMDAVEGLVAHARPA